MALAHVRASATLAKVQGSLRKISALIHREDAVGVIAQRIIASDGRVVDAVNRILSAMWLSQDGRTPKLDEAIDVFGWEVVREVAIVAMVHQVNAELAPRAGIGPLDADRLAIAVLTGAAELGASPYAALLANIGSAGLAFLGEERYGQMRRVPVRTSEDIVEAERITFGFDHGVLAAFMLYETDFPDRVCCEVFDHNMPSSPIWLAEQLAREAGIDAGVPVSANPLARETLLANDYTEGRIERIQKSMLAAAELPHVVFASMMHAAA
ncbi:MAG TPA: HDOD domain-containing protein [Fimbriimonas sp.]|nr:HDOD domain-containing protein [Fimbriimonas sp.]